MIVLILLGAPKGLIAVDTFVRPVICPNKFSGALERPSDPTQNPFSVRLSIINFEFLKAAISGLTS